MPNRTAIILAGPNGAGKSTAKQVLIAPTMAFVNADEIARSLRDAGGAEGLSTDIAAGRLLLSRLDELVSQGEDFATETNLANKSLLLRIPRWQEAGYKVALFYLWVPSPDFAINRVKQRVLAGGHDVPQETIRRRYYVGLENFFNVYSPVVDRWRLYDTSGPGTPVLIERGIRQVRNRTLWLQIRQIKASNAGGEE